MSTQEYCNQIMSQVHASHHHFLVQETQFFFYLTVRKQFKNISQEAETVKNLEAVADQSAELLQMELELKHARDIIAALQAKLENAERKYFKLSSDSKLKSEENKSEIKLLKDSIKKSDGEAKENTNAFKEVKQQVKTKEKSSTDTCQLIRDY